MTVSLSNPFLHASNKSGNIKLEKVGKALSEGKDSTVGVVALSLAGSLRTKADLLNAVNKTNAYASSALTVAHESLKKISDGLKSALIDAKQVVGSMPAADKAKLSTAVKLKIDNIKNQINTSEFNGTKLLTGGLGGDSSLTKLTKEVAIGADILPTANGRFVRTTAVNTDSIQIAAATAGDKVTIRGVEFTFVNALSGNKDNEILVGGNDHTTAKNMALTIANSKNAALSGISVDIAPGALDTVLLKNESGKERLNITTSNPLTTLVANPTAGTHGVDFSRLRNINMEDIKNADVSVSQHSNDGAARALAATAGIIPAGAHANDSGAALKVKIGNSEFVGIAYHDNGASLNNAQIKFTNSSTGETFSITMSAAGGNINDHAAAIALANDIQTHLRNLNLTETTKLEINTSKGNIKDADGTNIASLKGMSAKITSHSSIENKSFTDFKIERSGTDTKFTAKIVDKKGEESTFSVTVAAANIADLVAGKKLTLTHAASHDTLSINIGEFGLTSLAEPKNIDKISDSLRDAFVKPGMRIRTNTAFNNTIDVKVKNLSSDSLFKDNDGTLVKDFDLGDDTGVKKTEEVLERTLAIIDNEIANVATQIENLRNIADEINSLAASSENAAGNYDNTDIAKKSQEFNKLLTQLRVELSIIGAGNRSVDEVVQYMRDTIRQ